MPKEKIILTGSCGMLAADLIPQLVSAGYELVLTDAVQLRSDVTLLNICDTAAVAAFVKNHKPKWIVNCAAYTKVDDAEREYSLAFAVNSVGPANLARAAKEVGSKLLHISSDYVFGGASTDRKNPYTEEDELAPTGLYGQSKRFGDELVRALLPENSLIVRTSWLHGINGPNFVDTMLRLGTDKGEVKVVNDQVGSPTWTVWLVAVICKLISRQAVGIYNASSRGGISWFDFSKEIFLQAKMKVDVKPISTAAFARPAPRPAYSTLDVTKLEKFLGETCPPWQESVREHLMARSRV